MTDTVMLAAAHSLVGMELENGWKVIEKIEREHNGTGGHFSVSYIVRNEKGHKAFLKVLDLARALSIPGDQLQIVQQLINQFNFEREPETASPTLYGSRGGTDPFA